MPAWTPAGPVRTGVDTGQVAPGAAGAQGAAATRSGPAKRKYCLLGVRNRNEALAPGHTQARTHFGTSRYSVDLYDPYYWLGVAHMELGEVLEAKNNLLHSRSEGVIDGFPEFADLLGRLGALERREAQQAAALAPTPAPQEAAPTVPTSTAPNPRDPAPPPPAT